MDNHAKAAVSGDGLDLSKIGGDAAGTDLGKVTDNLGDGVNGIGKTDINIPDAPNVPHDHVNIDHPNTGDHAPTDAPPAREPGHTGVNSGDHPTPGHDSSPVGDASGHQPSDSSGHQPNDHGGHGHGHSDGTSGLGDGTKESPRRYEYSNPAESLHASHEPSVHADGTREDFLRNYSRESLSHLERYMLDRWPTYEDFQVDNDTDFIDGAVRYIGETLLRACGGGWHYSDEPGFVFSGRPYLRLDTLDGTPGSPFNLMTALLHRRTGGELTKVFDAQVRRIEKRRAQEDPGWEPHRDPVPGMIP